MGTQSPDVSVFALVGGTAVAVCTDTPLTIAVLPNMSAPVHLCNRVELCVVDLSSPMTLTLSLITL